MCGQSLTYNHIPVFEASAPESGIHLTLVGTCSSALDTHGFWWKNQFSSLGIGVVFYVDSGGTVLGVVIVIIIIIIIIIIITINIIIASVWTASFTAFITANR